MISEEVEHLSLLCMAAGLVFGVDHLPVDEDIEHAAIASDDPQVLDHMLIVTQQIGDHAHGVV